MITVPPLRCGYIEKTHRLQTVSFLCIYVSFIIQLLYRISFFPEGESTRVTKNLFGGVGLL